MAHQDDAGLRSVKQSGHAGSRTSAVHPSGSAVRLLPWGRLQNRKTDRWNHARRSDGSDQPLSGGSVWILCSGGNFGAAASSAGCTSRGVTNPGSGVFSSPEVRDLIRRRAVPSLGKGPAGSDALRATSESPRRVLESRLSWRLEACRILPRESATRLLRTGLHSSTATPSARVTPVVVYGFVLRLLRKVA